MNWKRIVRDAVLIWVLTALGGLVIGIIDASLDAQLGMPAIAISNIVMSIIGFAISGSLTRVNRVRHLLSVSGLVWLLGLVNLALGVTLIQWLASIIAILIACAIGGAIAALMFNATQSESTALPR